MTNTNDQNTSQHGVPEMQSPQMREQFEEAREQYKAVEDHHGLTPFVPPANEDGSYTLTREQLGEVLNVVHLRTAMSNSKAVYDTLEAMTKDPDMTIENVLANLAWLSATTLNEAVDQMHRCLADNPFPLHDYTGPETKADE